MTNATVLVGWRRRWNRNLLQFLGRRVRSTVEVEDLAQEIYLRWRRARIVQHGAKGQRVRRAGRACRGRMAPRVPVHGGLQRR